MGGGPSRGGVEKVKRERSRDGELLGFAIAITTNASDKDWDWTKGSYFAPDGMLYDRGRNSRASTNLPRSLARLRGREPVNC